MPQRGVVKPRLAPSLPWTLVLLSLAGCTDARRSKRHDAQPTSPAPAATSAPGSASEAAPVAPAAPPAPTAPTPAASSPAELQGKATLQLSLPGKLKLGGFALTATWDPGQFALGQPASEAALKDYLCQANVAVPGTIRYNCAGLPDAERGGLLATIPLRFKDRAPKVEDFKIVQDEVVDDLGRSLPELHVALAVVPASPPAAP